MLEEQKLDDLGSLALHEALRQGAEDADCYLESKKKIEVLIANNRVCSVRSKCIQGIGIRAIRRGSLGFYASTILSKEDILSASRFAVKLSSVSTSDAKIALPASSPSSTTRGIFDKKIAQVDAKELCNMANTLCDRSREYSANVMVNEGKLACEIRSVAILNSRGVEKTMRDTSMMAYLIYVAKKHLSTSNFSYEYLVSRQLCYPEAMGLKAAKGALDSLTPREVGRFHGPVILMPEPAARVLFVPLIYSLNARNVAGNSSFLAESLGDHVACDNLNIYDDGTLDRGPWSAPFDAEGNPTSKTELITSGHLKGFLHDEYTARRSGCHPTGNSLREEYTMPPKIGATNFIVHSGERSLHEMISEIEKGVLIHSLSVNIHPLSGHFSGLIKLGFLIRHGEIACALKGTTISGNAYSLLNKIDALGKEKRFTPLHVYVGPTMLNDVFIAGK